MTEAPEEYPDVPSDDEVASADLGVEGQLEEPAAGSILRPSA